MSSAVIANFKNLILLVCKTGTSLPDCPMNSVIMGQFIEWVFHDQARAARIPIKYRENRAAVDKLYREKGSSFAEVLKNRDRSLFGHFELFPVEISKRFSPYIEWFSNYLYERIEDRHIEWVWRYLEKIDEQVPW